MRENNKENKYDHGHQFVELYQEFIKSATPDYHEVACIGQVVVVDA